MHILSHETDNCLFLSVKNAHDQSQRKICGRAGVEPVTPGFAVRLALVARRLSCNVQMYTWAASWQNQQNSLCAQRRLRSVWASTQSDQSLRCPHEKTLGPQLPIEHTANDQTGRMPRLIWVFAGRKCHFVGFVMRWLGHSESTSISSLGASEIKAGLSSAVDSESDCRAKDR